MGTQAGTEVDTMEECCLLACSGCFQTHLPREGVAHSGLGPTCQSEKEVTEVCLGGGVGEREELGVNTDQSDGDSYSNEGPFSQGTLGCVNLTAKATNKACNTRTRSFLAG